MQHTSELEQMVNLLALTADVMRKLAARQEEEPRTAIRGLADDVEGIAERLIEVLFPGRRGQDGETKHIGPA